MNVDRLYEILNETTIQLRKGDVVHGDKALVDAINEGKPADQLPGGVVTFDMMPPVEAAQPHLELVDMEFLKIGVDKEMAMARKAELVELLKDYPNPDRLAGGPSYIEVGAEIGDQGAAFQLFALGKVMGLWEVITPATLGITGPQATQLAGSGMIMITGHKANG